MATPAVPQDLYSYCTLLRSELQRVHDRLDPPTPAIIAVGHTAIPLAETLPTAQDAPSRYSCTLVVPDSVVGHIVGVKKGPSRLSGDPAPPPPGPVPVLPNASDEGARPLKKRAHPVHPSQPPAPVPPPPAASAQPHPGAATQPRKSGVRFAPQESSYPASNSLPHNPATISIPTQVMASPIPTPRPSSTPYAPSVAMPTAVPSPSPRSVAPSPMAIDAIRPERGRQQQTARRGGTYSSVAIQNFERSFILLGFGLHRGDES
ncbi:hypothetical protein R3P38DRAFT_3312156 [Favolaschia claudopus]|uniref:Uncharacterized protein n=1 Tax=Favolaschia claudopus TaxID=2862362 RepID=A0AAW0C5U4_9AGAR